MKKLFTVILVAVMVAAMAAPIFAADFVASIEVKPAPEVVEITEDDKTFGAVIIDEQSEQTVEGVPTYDEKASSTILEFFVISAAEKAEAALPEISSGITSAENQIKKAPDLGKLDDGLDKELVKSIDEFYGDSKDKIGVKDLVVSDVFDASLVRDKARLEQVKQGQKVRFILKPSFAKDSFFVLLHNTDGTNWEVVKDVEWTKDGYLAVTVNKLSVFALIVEKTADLPVTPGGPDSPQTNIGTGYKFMYIGIAAVCLGGAAVFFTKAKKKAKAN